MKFVEYPDRDLMVFDLADQMASELAEALRGQDRVSMSVPGGTTPGPVFDILSGLHLDWARVTVLPNDERWVPEDHPRSNARLIRARLLTGRASAASYVSLHAEAPEPDAVLDQLAAAVAPHLPLSVALLGMGEDMHTASLFPGADRLAEALAPEAPVILPMRAEAAGEPRMTLTARVLADAMSIHLLIAGAAKREAFERAATLPVDQAPVGAILANAIVHWAE